MPFYEYQCQACGAHHEAMQKISDPPLKKCPECGKSRLQKLVSAPVFRLKGGGWYETDFKSDKETKRNLAGEDKAEKTEKSESSDAKPAVTPPKADAPAKTTAAKAAPAKKSAPKKKAPAKKAPAKKAAKRR
jgi:putative FmdB family regulatory protein